MWDMHKRSGVETCYVAPKDETKMAYEAVSLFIGGMGEVMKKAGAQSAAILPKDVHRLFPDFAHDVGLPPKFCEVRDGRSWAVSIYYDVGRSHGVRVPVRFLNGRPFESKLAKALIGWEKMDQFWSAVIEACKAFRPHLSWSHLDVSELAS